VINYSLRYKLFHVGHVCKGLIFFSFILFAASLCPPAITYWFAKDWKWLNCHDDKNASCLL